MTSHPLAGSGLEQFAKAPDTLDALLSEAVPLHRFEIGGRFEGKPLALRLLNVEETAVARMTAAKRLRELGFERDDVVTDTGHDLFELFVMAEILARALVTPPPAVGLAPKPLAKDGDHVRQRMLPGEIEAIFKEYAWFKTERSPLERMESWDEARAYAESLASGKVSRVPESLLRFDAGTLRRITLSLADLASKRTRPSSSATSPPSSSTPDSSTRATETDDSSPS
jgi:hypothetical protein